MKILMLTTNSSLMDGINRHILTIAPILNKMKDCHVAVCTVFPKGELNAELEKYGVSTYSLCCHSGHDFRILRRYYSILKDFQPEIVHIHVMALMERIISCFCFRGIKYISTIHGLSDKVKVATSKMRLEKLLNSLFQVRMSAICYISNGVRDALIGNGSGKKEYVVYNPLSFRENCHNDNKLVKLLNVELGTQVIGTCCRIAQVKNPLAFTEVMCNVLSKLNNVHAVVIGDGDVELVDSCKKIVQKFGVEGRFHWLGYRSDAPQLTRELDCFVMTSISEGMPTSLLECMTAKTPFAFLEGNGGLKDIALLNKEQGPFSIVAPENDLQGLANQICMLLKNPDMAEEYGEKAFEVGKQNFDVQSVAEKLLDIYNSL
ncbi:MAG: glycosyltransferase family 4 protein [Bacteroidales bacterium]|nr:glycosyltransferase family 4 protein [Bacteroidales bacterium]